MKTDITTRLSLIAESINPHWGAMLHEAIALIIAQREVERAARATDCCGGVDCAACKRLDTALAALDAVTK